MKAVVQSRFADERVSFVFDKQAEKKMVRDAWEDFLAQAPIDVRGYFGSDPRFEKDEEFLPLQAADFLAWLARARLLAQYFGVKGRNVSWPAPEKRHKSQVYLYQRARLIDIRRALDNPFQGIRAMKGGGVQIQVGPGLSLMPIDALIRTLKEPKS